MRIDAGFWRGRRVLVTGHTGFKGGWLSVWLDELGADVAGLALPAAGPPSLAELIGLEPGAGQVLGDVGDPEALREAFDLARPQIVFHLAAQPLVSRGYEDPDGTFATNVQGTVRLLSELRRRPTVRACVVVTSDKCYRQPARWCRETDPLGGHDPYSASKAAAELAVEAWRESFLRPGAGLGVATARAGNVIGGGDYARGRLVPDIIRAWQACEPCGLREPGGIRPWQHVLDALAGYLMLAQALVEAPAAYATAWNFGPDQHGLWTAGRLAHGLAQELDGLEFTDAPAGPLAEVRVLSLDAARARCHLGWRQQLELEDAIRWTAEAYRRLAAGEGRAVLTDQIARYRALPAGGGWIAQDLVRRPPREEAANVRSRR